MNRASLMLVVRLLLVQVALGSFALVLVAVFASRLLLLSPTVVGEAVPGAGACVVMLFASSLVSSVVLTAPVRRTLALLWEGSPDVLPSDLLKLYRLPAQLVVVQSTCTLVAAAVGLFHPIRPAEIDLSTAVSLVLLAVTFASATTLPLYVMLRSQVAMVLEAAPLEATRDAIFLLAEQAPYRTHVARRFVFAVTVPIAFVALGASLLTVSHVSAWDREAEMADAERLALGAFDLVDGSSVGRGAALEAAAAHGGRVKLSPRKVSRELRVDDDGTASLEVPLEDGHVTLSFPVNPPTGLMWIFGVLILASTTLAGILGARLGARFVADLSIATRAVRETGAADVLRGSRVRREARFDSVIGLMDAVDSLGGVFREFASAQERAIDARAATERMRALFLASMSHDLKGPLNAVLGFANLVSRSPLSPAQHESLTIIEQRGRELLALIHTVLDSARVEAGELSMSNDSPMVGDVVMSAVLDARDLAAGSNVEIVAEIQPGVPRLYADGARLVQALTAVIQSAVRFTEQGTVHVRATLPAGGDSLRVDVESSGRSIAAAERDKLFDAFRDSDRARRHGSLGLGLALARSILELSGGSIDVAGTKLGGTVFHLSIPTAEEETAIGTNEIVDATSE